MKINWFDPRHFESDKPLVVNGYPAAPLVAGIAHGRLSYKSEFEIKAALNHYGWGATLYSPGGDTRKERRATKGRPAGAQAYTALHAATKIAILAFRGSEGREFFRDWLMTDLRAGIMRRMPGKLPDKVRCGWGFQAPVEELWPVILEIAKMQAKGWKLIMLGHSMGADLAHLAAGRLICEELIYPDLVIGYEPAKLWNRIGQGWQWTLVNSKKPFRSYTFMNSERGHLDLITDLPPWARHGGWLLVAGEDKVYTGEGALRRYNEGKPPYRHRLPGWRPISRLFARLGNRAQGRIGAHLGDHIVEKLERLYLEGQMGHV